MQTVEALGEERSASAWQLSGSVPSAPLSFFYRLGMAAVAVAMVLLPLVYLGLIACVGYYTYRYAIDGTAIFEGRGNGQGKIIMYVGPLVIGSLVVIFMVKPLFARRQKSSEPREIKRSEAPDLFTLIDQICDVVRAPRPSKVALDMQVNASASFRRGFLSLFRNDLTLTIGLPLAAGLTVREFGGVLAHEFGHFAQGAGMRLTYIVRSINAWFARLVYERDAWDDYLRGLAGVDLRIGIIIHLARFMIWLTRKLLWVFMMAGHGISCFMLRQMEFDADYYETRVAGSDGFTATARRLPVLGAAWHRVIAQQQESFESKRLADDIPSLVALATNRLPAPVLEAIEKSAQEGKTGWFDTHPCDSDRVRAAERIGAKGILVGDEPASTLFGDFGQVARPATSAYYRDECEIPLDDVQLLSFTTVAADADKILREEAAVAEVFSDLLSIRTLIFSTSGVASTPAIGSVSFSDDRERQREPAGPGKEALKLLLEADNRWVLAKQARGLLKAGFTIKKADFQLSASSGTGVEMAAEQCKQEIAAQEAVLAEFLQAISRRISLAVTALASSENTTEEFAEATRLLTVLGCFEGTAGLIVELRDEVAALELLLQNWGNASDEMKLLNTARSYGASIQFTLTALLQRVAGVSYPFPHANGMVPLSTFLDTSEPHEEEAVRCFLRGQAVLNHFFSLYFKIAGRLAALTVQSEALTAAAGASPQAACTDY